MNQGLKQSEADYTGNDGIADFYLFIAMTLPWCECCGEVGPCIVYSDRNEGGISTALSGRFTIKPWPRTLILKEPKQPIGIACGCYAKFQRQLVHIGITNHKPS